jgi:hypothetical protein
MKLRLSTRRSKPNLTPTKASLILQVPTLGSGGKLKFSKEMAQLPRFCRLSICTFAQNLNGLLISKNRRKRTKRKLISLGKTMLCTAWMPQTQMAFQWTKLSTELMMDAFTNELTCSFNHAIPSLTIKTPF